MLFPKQGTPNNTADLMLESNVVKSFTESRFF